MTFAQELKQKIILANFGGNYQVQVVAGQLHNFSLPFNSLVADTVDGQVQMMSRGSHLLLATDSSEQVTIVVRDQDYPHRTLSLTLVPTGKKVYNYQVIVPEILQAQTMLAQQDLSADEYMLNLGRLIRHTVELTNSAKAIPKAKHSTYSLQNFTLLSTELGATELALLELKKKSDYPALTCLPTGVVIEREQEFQPTNYYYAGIKVKSLWLVNNSGNVFTWEPTSCSQANAMAAVMVKKSQILPGDRAQVVLLEQVNY
ncbi:hypothetical protein CKF54_02435 [Psittacicella hinzii]|uniref:Uncharacterized protein n=2 Tax=Psittacicella hinzii TaxID=2028575 RepID=A0A3A1Y8Y5_9GAMM|nr:hypothetical protein CKF54_02435 [Psittacicella hinzii]